MEQSKVTQLRMKNTPITIAILAYPGGTKSAQYGLQEMFELANQACTEQDITVQFDTNILQVTDIYDINNPRYDIVILPPASNDHFYLNPNEALLIWLCKQHTQGAVLTSACAGAFILAKTGLIQTQKMTTHWRLERDFKTRFPEITLAIDKILVNEGSIITAGGMMSWLDLGLELIAQFSHPSVMRQIGKMLVVDTGQREQRYYQQFNPVFNHGDEVIVKLQQHLQRTSRLNTTITALAAFCHLTPRTFLRKFHKVTGYKPTEYIQRLRIQKACELLETSHYSFEYIANQVGYEDTGACRKIFVRIMGLTPSEFRKRFMK